MQSIAIIIGNSCSWTVCARTRVEEKVGSYSGEYSSVLYVSVVYVLLTLSTCIRGHSSYSVCLAVTALAATYLFYILKAVCH